jgi:hypothetical protein
VAIERPRARAADGSGEVELATYRHFAERDALTDVVLERLLAGVSTRRLDTDGVKHALGLWDGSTENVTVATTVMPCACSEHGPRSRRIPAASHGGSTNPQHGRIRLRRSAHQAQCRTGDWPCLSTAAPDDCRAHTVLDASECSIHEALRASLRWSQRPVVMARIPATIRGSQRILRSSEGARSCHRRQRSLVSYANEHSRRTLRD